MVQDLQVEGLYLAALVPPLPAPMTSRSKSYLVPFSVIVPNGNVQMPTLPGCTLCARPGAACTSPSAEVKFEYECEDDGVVFDTLTPEHLQVRVSTAC